MRREDDDISDDITLFLCGDVMTGRGIDQILPNPSDPRLYEAYVKSARYYVELAERAHGPIPRPVEPAYIWGDALIELRQVRPDLKIVNLETSITESTDWQPKGVNYRMHPLNIECLTVAGIDGCTLANNHVLDWGYSGLTDTLEALRDAGIKSAGAGATLAEAGLPAIFDIAGKGRVLVYSLGSTSSGIPRAWGASADGPGVNLLPDLSPRTASRIAKKINEIRRDGDIVVASIHWGENWGYTIPREQTEFAHRLIDESGADVVHGHSSHHPKGIEVHKDKPVFYGCGDFLNDYEGIGNYGAFRDDLVLMYFVTIDPTMRTLRRLTMTPLQIRKFRLNRSTAKDMRWLQAVMNGQVRRFGSGIRQTDGGRFVLDWT